MNINYAKTVFLYCYSNRPSPVKESNEYPHYFFYECGITDATSFHKSLINNGYFEEASIEAKLGMLTVSELKNILSDLNQLTKGRKAYLIDRIISVSDKSFLQKYFLMPYYSISEKGKKFVKEHNDYVKVYEHSRDWGITVDEFDEYKRPGYSFYDVCWGIFNKRLKSDKKFGRNQYLNMFELLEKENKKSEAIKMLIRVIYIDVSGVVLLPFLNIYKFGIYTKSDLKDTYQANIMLAPGVINLLKNYADYYNESYIDDLYNWKLPIQICNKQLFLSMIHDGLNGNFNFDYYELKLKNAYYKAIDLL